MYSATRKLPARLALEGDGGQVISVGPNMVWAVWIPSAPAALGAIAVSSATDDASGG